MIDLGNLGKELSILFIIIAVIILVYKFSNFILQKIFVIAGPYGLFGLIALFIILVYILMKLGYTPSTQLFLGGIK